MAIVTGMGTELATTGTTGLLDAVQVERVVVVGITGAVDDETPIGTLILPELVVERGDREANTAPHRWAKGHRRGRCGPPTP